MKDPKPRNYVNPDMPFAVVANIHASFYRPSELDQLISEIRKPRVRTQDRKKS